MLAIAHIGWVTSPDVQKIIREFSREKCGQAFFHFGL